MTEAMNFATLYELNVKLVDDEFGELGPARLRFGAGRLALISFGLLSAPTLVPDRGRRGVLRATTSEGARFTLFSCKRIGASFWAELVVAGDVAGAFKRIEIRYSDISEWFCPWKPLSGEVGKSVSWMNPIEHLAATVRTGGEEFAVTTRSETSITQSGEDQIFHEHVLFCLEKGHGHFNQQDVQTKALELEHLLSILIALPLSIVSVRVTCENDIEHMAYFSTWKPLKRDADDTDSPARFFISEKSIHHHWERIFTRYFASPYRKISWSRLAGMQHYEGFWEYRALGYVTLLDKYVDMQYRSAKRSMKIKVPVEPMRQARWNSTLDAISPRLGRGQRDAINRAVNELFSRKREPTFAEKWRCAIDGTDEDVVKIVAITDDDFELIKKVRNTVAHGKAFDFPEEDMERIDSIVTRIALLMTYWAFADVGLTNDDFFRCLSTTHNELRFRARPDVKHIARMTKPQSFFTVSTDRFKQLSSIKRIRVNPCFSKDSSGQLKYSEKYSAAYRKWLTDPSASYKMAEWSEIFGVAKERISYMDSAYIECGDESIEVTCAWIIQSE